MLLEKVQEKLKQKKAEADVLTKKWEEEKATIEGRKKMRAQLDQYRVELEQAKRNGDYAK